MDLVPKLDAHTHTQLLLFSFRQQHALFPVSGSLWLLNLSESCPSGNPYILIRVRAPLIGGWFTVILHPQRVMCKLPALILRALDLVFIVCRFLNSPHRISQSRCSCCRTFFYCMPLAKLLLHFYTLKRKFCCFYNLPGGTRSKWAVTFQ